MAKLLSHLTALVMFPAAVSAQGAPTPQYLPTAEVVRQVMDGRPWNGLSASGRQARITLNKDGSGTFEGPMTMSISWTIKQNDICLNLGFAGTKCLRFVAIPKGYQAYNEGKVDLTFTR